MKYLNKLARQVTFNALSTQSQSAFDDYLRRQGIDPDTINEVEVGKILSL